MGKTLIYHITPIDNLVSICECGGIHCKYKQPDGCRNIAYEHIQARRSSTIVPIPPGGTLHNYAPFYFAPRSPMLFAINKGLIEGYSDGQQRIIYIVSSVEKIEECQLDYVFTDGHAAMAFSEFYDQPPDLDKIDWEVMHSRYWNDTPEDGDRKRRRQAEFLVYNFLPLEAILGIGVYNESVKKEAVKLLAPKRVQISVRVFRDWYY
jgi:hypothetical protein